MDFRGFSFLVSLNVMIFRSEGISLGRHFSAAVRSIFPGDPMMELGEKLFFYLGTKLRVGSKLVFNPALKWSRGENIFSSQLHDGAGGKHIFVPRNEVARGGKTSFGRKTKAA